MKKQVIFLIAILNVISCGEVGPTYEQITAIKPISQRIDDINKTKAELKNSEDLIALVFEEPLYLEFEYPVRENESYVIKYRFDDSGCYEIKLDTYFNKQDDTQKVLEAIIKDIDVNTTLGAPKKELDFYRWENSKMSIEINTQLIERGIISITILNNISLTF